MQTKPPFAQDSAQAMDDGLVEAATAAGYAPSIHNTQPWRWLVGPNTLDLYLERSRVLAVTDPDTRLAVLSCGAALHHARTTLAAEGWDAVVERMPDAADQEHLARVRVGQPATADPEAVRHVRTIPLRHTNRAPAAGNPVGREDLRVITEAMQAQGGWLLVLSASQIIELSAAADQAQRSEAAEPEWRAELAYWTGGVRPSGLGVPDAVIPQQATRTTVPGRDFGHHGGLPVSADHDTAALFAILYGHSDEPRDWLRAGEALSAGWLTATERGISVLPLSAPVEVIGTRDTMRRILSYLSHPYLVLRFGTEEPVDATAPHSPRLPASQIIRRA